MINRELFVTRITVPGHNEGTLTFEKTDTNLGTVCVSLRKGEEFIHLIAYVEDLKKAIDKL
jgi:hypothetical protein